MGVLKDTFIPVKSKINQIEANAKTHLSYQKYEFTTSSNWVLKNSKYELTITSADPISLEVYEWDDTNSVYKALDDDQYEIRIESQSVTIIHATGFVGMIVLGYTYKDPTFGYSITKTTPPEATITSIGNPSSNSYVAIPSTISATQKDSKEQITYTIKGLNIVNADSIISTLDMSNTNITSVEIGNWSNLTKIVFSESTTTIGVLHTSQLKSLDLPGSVKTLLPQWGSHLAGIGDTVYLPTGLTSISGSAFPDNIEKFKFKDGKSTNNYYTLIDGATGDTSASGQIIAKNLDDDKYSLVCATSNTTVIPGSVTTIEDYFTADAFETLNIGDISYYGGNLGIGNLTTKSITFNTNGEYPPILSIETSFMKVNELYVKDSENKPKPSSLTVYPVSTSGPYSAIYCERISRKVILIFVDKNGRTDYPYDTVLSHACPYDMSVLKEKDEDAENVKKYPYFGNLNARPVRYNVDKPTEDPTVPGVWLWKKSNDKYEIKLITTATAVDGTITTTKNITSSILSGINYIDLSTYPNWNVDDDDVADGYYIKVFGTYAELSIKGSCMAFAIRDQGENTGALNVKAGTKILSRGAVGVTQSFNHPDGKNYIFSAYPTIDFSDSDIKYIESLDVNNQKGMGSDDVTKKTYGIPVLSQAQDIDIPPSVIYARGGERGPGVNAITTTDLSGLYNTVAVKSVKDDDGKVSDKYVDEGTLYTYDGNGNASILVCEPHFTYTTDNSVVEYRTEYVAPSSVTDLGVYSLTNPNLTELDLSLATGLKVIGQYATFLPACTTLTLPEGLVAIMAWGIRCPKLTTLELPSTIKYLANNCFTTDSLTLLDMSKVTLPNTSTNVSMFVKSFYAKHANLKIKGYPSDPKDSTKPSLAKAVAEELGGPDRFIDVTKTTTTTDSSDIEQ